MSAHQVVNPATEEVVCAVPGTSVEQVDAGNLSVHSHSSVCYWTPLNAFTDVKNVFIST